MVVLHHDVLFEEAEGLFGRRGGQADDGGIKVIEHLPPKVVNGAMALVRDDEIELFDGEVGIVFNGDGLLEESGRGVSPLAAFLIQRREPAATLGHRTADSFKAFDGQIVEVGRGLFLAPEHGVDTLDCADDDAGRFVERVAAETLDDVFLGELVVVDWRNELLEFLQRLVAQIAPVHEKQDAFRPGVFDQPIVEIHRGVRFS